MLRWLRIGIILAEIICESSNWQHIQRLKITILGANWQLFRLERIAKCSYFMLSTQNIKFYWFVMKIKTIIMLPIWWYNRGLFPLGNKYIWGLRSEWVKVILRRFEVFSDVWIENAALFNRLMKIHSNPQIMSTCVCSHCMHVVHFFFLYCWLWFEIDNTFSIDPNPMYLRHVNQRI